MSVRDLVRRPVKGLSPASIPRPEPVRESVRSPPEARSRPAGRPDAGGKDAFPYPFAMAVTWWLAAASPFFLAPPAWVIALSAPRAAGRRGRSPGRDGAGPAGRSVPEAADRTAGPAEGRERGR
jgi:hypothetical protein